MIRAYVDYSGFPDNDGGAWAVVADLPQQERHLTFGGLLSREEAHEQGALQRAFAFLLHVGINKAKVYTDHPPCLQLHAPAQLSLHWISRDAESHRRAHHIARALSQAYRASKKIVRKSAPVYVPELPFGYVMKTSRKSKHTVIVHPYGWQQAVKRNPAAINFILQRFRDREETLQSLSLRLPIQQSTVIINGQVLPINFKGNRPYVRAADGDKIYLHQYLDTSESLMYELESRQTNATLQDKVIASESRPGGKLHFTSTTVRYGSIRLPIIQQATGKRKHRKTRNYVRLPTGALFQIDSPTDQNRLLHWLDHHAPLQPVALPTTPRSQALYAALSTEPLPFRELARRANCSPSYARVLTSQLVREGKAAIQVIDGLQHARRFVPEVT